MKPRIAVLARSICQDQNLTSRIEKKFPNIDFQFATPERCLDYTYLAENFKKVEKMVIGHQMLDTNFLKNHPHLREISKYGVGTDNIDFAACKASNVSVHVDFEVNKYYVAEHALGLMLGCMRNISNSTHDMRQGIWKRDGGFSLQGKVIGIIGFGRIGQSLTRILSAFPVKVFYFDIADRNQEAGKLGAEYLELNELLAESDAVSIHVPLSDQTKGMVDTEFLSKMKSSAILINTSRGAVVRMADLKGALESGGVRAAALDVFPEEPFKDADFLDAKNLLATPHIAANCMEAKTKMADSAVALLTQDFSK